VHQYAEDLYFGADQDSDCVVCSQSRDYRREDSSAEECGYDFLSERCGCYGFDFYDAPCLCDFSYGPLSLYLRAVIAFVTPGRPF